MRIYDGRRKPLIWLVRGNWYCGGVGRIAGGPTIRAAYEAWKVTPRES